MSNATQDAPVAVPEIVIPPPASLSEAGPFLSREQILDATDACFAESGYDGTTIRAIAARLGCSVGSIYRYFRDKRDLLLACGRRMMRPVIEEPTFDESMAAYRAIATERGQMYRLGFWLVGDGAGIPEFIDRILDHWGELLGNRSDAEQRWAMTHGLLMLGRTDQVDQKLPPPAAPVMMYTDPRVEPEDMTLL